MALDVFLSRPCTAPSRMRNCSGPCEYWGCLARVRVKRWGTRKGEPGNTRELGMGGPKKQKGYLASFFGNACLDLGSVLCLALLL